MFAILLTEGMDPFYQNIASFPTAVFTLLLAVCVLYWLSAVLGLVSVDVLDFDIPESVGAEDLNADSGASGPDVLAGLMLKFGLYGVPVTIIVSILSLVGWLLCYYLVHFSLGYAPEWLAASWARYVIGLPLLVGSLYVAVLITAQLIKPLRPLFLKSSQETVKYVLGQTAIVRTSRVDNDFGEATLDDGGAGLILKIRTAGDVRFVKGDRVVAIEKIAGTDYYRVVSEQEFAS